MTDTLIWCFLCLVAGLWLGFMLCVILTWGSISKWKACGSAYKSGRVSALHELYRQIAQLQKEAKGKDWSILNEILDLISGMLPKNIREE